MIRLLVLAALMLGMAPSADAGCGLFGRWQARRAARIQARQCTPQAVQAVQCVQCAPQAAPQAAPVVVQYAPAPQAVVVAAPVVRMPITPVRTAVRSCRILNGVKVCQ